MGQYFEYLGTLLLLGFLLWSFLWAIGIGLALLAVSVAFLGPPERRSSLQRSTYLAQPVQCVLFGALLGLVAARYTGSNQVSHPWLYAGTAFLLTALVLAANVQEKDRATANRPAAGAQGRAGAEIGLAGGILFFPIAYHWPHVMLLIPGVATSVNGLLHFASWLLGFLLVDIILVVAGIAFLDKVASIGLIALAGVAAATWSSVRKLVAPRPAA